MMSRVTDNKNGSEPGEQQQVVSKRSLRFADRITEDIPNHHPHHHHRRRRRRPLDEDDDDAEDSEVSSSSSSSATDDHDDDVEAARAVATAAASTPKVVVEEVLEHSSRSGGSGSLRGSLTRRTSSRRTSLVTDLESGKLGRARSQTALLRHENSRLARPHRKRVEFRKWFGLNDRQQQHKRDDDEDDDEMFQSKHGRYIVSSRGAAASHDHHHNNNSYDDDDDDDDELSSTAAAANRQYSLRAVKPQPNKQTQNKLLRWLGVTGDTTLTIYEAPDPSRGTGGCVCCGCNPNSVVVNFLHWTFRQTFTTVLLTATVGFFLFTVLFALFIWLTGLAYPTCIGGIDYGQKFYFLDAFELSWTTFSTVGYGIVHSGISETAINIHQCTAVTFLVTFEAFVGVLFASMCGAILFIKVSRIQSFAQVVFSDPICVRYGTGVSVERAGDDDDDDKNESEDGSMEDDLDQLPCPILEFRVANRRHSVVGGEIIDSTIHIVASIDASQACPPATNTMTTRRRRGKKGKKGGRRNRALMHQNSLRGSFIKRGNSFSSDDPRTTATTTSADHGISTTKDVAQPSLSSAGSSAEDLTMLDTNHATEFRQSATTRSYEEDPTGHLVPKKILTKLECESPDHPFFKRVWTIRHTLDQHSPLLTKNARQMVKRNRGFWPREFNSAAGVRSAIHFDQLLISVTGTSNADANSVYAQKIYDFVDMNVGYSFVNMLYRDPVDGSLRVDTSLINDVMEQAGGGGETLSAVREEKLQDIFVL